MKKTVLTALSVLLIVSAALSLTAEAAAPCSHAWENCICTLCGEMCQHPSFEDNRCTQCGIVCRHFNWRGDECAFCGVRCPHSYWEDGHCTLCGMACPHPYHDPDTRICPVCGAETEHRYENGVCTVCGAAEAFSARSIEQRMFYTSSAPGMLTELYYWPTDYENGGTLQKKINVYLPYGYSAQNRYDVLVLYHGMYESEDYWLNEDLLYHGEYDAMVTTKRLLDNMIAQGLCKPLIVVCPTFYPVSQNYNNFNREREQRQLALELRNDILPLIAGTYSTYATDWTVEAISQARDHFAYAGLSLGSIYGYNAALPECLDIISSFGCFSGSEADAYAVAKAVDSYAPDIYGVNCFFNSVGTRDSMGDQHRREYDILVRESAALAEGKNSWFIYVDGARHEYSAWVTGLYNFLPLAFPADG